MADRSGDQAVTSDRFYWIGGNKLVRNIPFRICADATRCALSQDKFVPEGGNWYFQDQLGFQDKPTANFVGTELGSDNTIYFLTNTANVAKPTNTVTKIFSFTAKMNCLFGKCAPCIRFDHVVFCHGHRATRARGRPSVWLLVSVTSFPSSFRRQPVFMVPQLYPLDVKIFLPRPWTLPVQ